MQHIHKPKLGHAHRHSSGHSHSHPAVHRASDRKKLLLAVVVTGSMMVIEFVAGLLVNSLALISDAGHMLTHFFALALSYGAIVIASSPVSQTKSFGLYRAEVLASLFNGITLLLITAYIFWEGYKRVLEPEPINKLPMFIVAVAGLIVNLLTAFILSKTDREDLNLKSAFLHMVTDTASSVVIIIGAVVIFFTDWYVVDPFLSLLLGAVILMWSWGLLRDSVNVLLEATPKQIKPEAVLAAFKNEIGAVQEVHDLHIWVITSKMYALTAHVTIPDMLVSETREILTQINALLDERFDIQHANIQFETEKSDLKGV